MRYLILRFLYWLARRVMRTVRAPELLTREDARRYAHQLVERAHR